MLGEVEVIDATLVRPIGSMKERSYFSYSRNVN